MTTVKKINHIEIDPIAVEYLPVSETTHQQVADEMISYSKIDDDSNWLNFALSDLKSWTLKGILAYYSEGFYLLRYLNTFKSVLIDIKNGDISTILGRSFTNISYGPRLKSIQQLVREGQYDEALILLNEVLLELETIDDFELRANWNILRAQIHQKNNRHLIAAVYYMEAATLTSSQKQEKKGVGKEALLVNKAGNLYLFSLQSLALYLKSNEVNEDFYYWVTDLANRAKLLLERESENSEISKYHMVKGGEINLGVVSLPYPVIFKDEKSASLNKKLALDAEKILCIIEKRELIRNLDEYLKEKKYIKDDVEFLLEVASQIVSSQKITLKESLEFFQHLEKVMGSSADYNECLSHLDILKVQVKLKHESASEQDILLFFKLLDKESKNEAQFLHLLAIADKISTQLPPATRKEFASIVLEKNYPFLTKSHKSCYQKLSEVNFVAKEPIINCLYPSNVIQFRENLNKLEVKDHHVIYKGKVEVLSHEKFKEVLVKRTRSLFPNENLKEFGHLLNKEKISVSHESDDLLGLAFKLMHDLHLEDNLKGVKERIKNDKARIGIFGLTKVGKSTFLNTLIGREILKSDRGVATNIQTIIKKGLLDKATVTFLNGITETIAVEEIGSFTSEQGNPQNKKKVLKVDVTLNCALPLGIELIDIPGFGAHEGNFELHKEVIETCLGVVDGVFLLTTPNDGLKSFELEFIKQATQTKKLPFVLIANKMDELNENETLDLKEGLIEKLSKHQIATDVFPTFFISAQMGLAFIEKIDKSRYFGMGLEDAKVESGIGAVRESLKQVGDKIHSQKEQSIMALLLSETDVHKSDMVQLMNDTELVQKSSKDDTKKIITHLESELSSLEQNVQSEFLKYNQLLTRLENYEIDGMATRVAGKIEFKKLSNRQEDLQVAEPLCVEIFKEEIGSVLKLMSEPLENALAKISKISVKNDYKLSALSRIVVNKNINENPETKTERLSYLLDKIFSKQETVHLECRRVLTHLKSLEILVRKKKLSDVEIKFGQLQKLISDRIKNLEHATSFNDKEFLDKKDYYMKQIEISNEYIEILSRVKGN